MKSFKSVATACGIITVVFLSTLSNGQLTDPLSVMVGDEVCFEGYIMDYFCIERGTLLDNPDVVTLEDPEKHSVHCLVDVAACYQSNYEILMEPGDNGDYFIRAFQFDDENGKQKLIDAARLVGQCSTCSGGGSLDNGFRAEIRGTVVSGRNGDIPAMVRLQSVQPSNDLDTTACLAGVTEPTNAPSPQKQNGQSSTYAPSQQKQNDQSSTYAPSQQKQNGQSSTYAPSKQIQNDQGTTEAPSKISQQDQMRSDEPTKQDDDDQKEIESDANDQDDNDEIEVDEKEENENEDGEDDPSQDIDESDQKSEKSDENESEGSDTSVKVMSALSVVSMGILLALSLTKIAAKPAA